MKKLDLSATSASIGAPLKKGSFDFLQSAYIELASSLLNIRNGSYNPSKIYILYGCKLLSSGGSSTISAGAVFCNGEVFLSPAQTIPDPAGANVIVCNLKTTQYSSGTEADTVTFTDLVARNIHNIRTVEYISTGLSGTGNLNGSTSADNDFLASIYFDNTIETRAISPDGDTVDFDCSKTIIYTVSPMGGGGAWVNLNINFDNAIPGTELLLQIPKTGSGGTWQTTPAGVFSSYNIVDIPQSAFSLSGTVIIIKIKFLGLVGTDFYTTTYYYKY